MRKEGHYDNKVEREILKTESSPRLMRIPKFSPDHSSTQTATASKRAAQNMDIKEMICEIVDLEGGITICQHDFGERGEKHRFKISSKEFV